MNVMSASDRVIDIGAGAGKERGRVVATGTPEQIASDPFSRTAPFFARATE